MGGMIVKTCHYFGCRNYITLKQLLRTIGIPQIKTRLVYEVGITQKHTSIQLDLLPY